MVHHFADTQCGRLERINKLMWEGQAVGGVPCVAAGDGAALGSVYEYLKKKKGFGLGF